MHAKDCLAQGTTAGACNGLVKEMTLNHKSLCILGILRTIVPQMAKVSTRKVR